jgi:hypothetical protein
VRRYESPRNLDRPGEVGEAGEIVVESVGVAGVEVVNIVVFKKSSPANSRHGTSKVRQCCSARVGDDARHERG